MNHFRVCENIYDLIGYTPLVRLKEISKRTGANIYAKLEYFNPGQSVKDRIAFHMISKAEQEGRLKPGGTVVEATSGNTGFSIAMICAAKGYRCILTIKDTISPEKYKAMLALGAELHECSAALPGDHPESYYNMAKRIADSTPNAIYLNQNFDCGNSEAHYMTTGPEIWAQTAGKITHYVACASTGGTISGTGKYLKAQNEDVQVIAVDAITGVLKRYKETGEFSWDPAVKTKLEGVGKNIIPDNVHFDTIDEFVQVDDEMSAYAIKQLASTEGIFAGYSSGAALAAVNYISESIRPGDHIVVLFPDHGSRYLNKVYDPAWMKAQGFLNGQRRLERIQASEKVQVSK